MAGPMTAYRCDVTSIQAAKSGMPTHKFLFTFAKCFALLYLLCGSVGRAVPSNIRDPWLKSNHCKIFTHDMNLLLKAEKVKIKKKRQESGQIDFLFKIMNVKKSDNVR